MMMPANSRQKLRALNRKSDPSNPSWSGKTRWEPEVFGMMAAENAVKS